MPRLTAERAAELRPVFGAFAGEHWHFVECVVKHRLRRERRCGVDREDVVSEVWLILWGYNAEKLLGATNPRGLLMVLVRQVVRQIVMNAIGFERSHVARGRHGQVWRYKGRVRGAAERWGLPLTDVQPDSRRAKWSVADEVPPGARWRRAGVLTPYQEVAARDLVEVAIGKVPPCLRERYAVVRRSVLRLERLAS